MNCSPKGYYWFFFSFVIFGCFDFCAYFNTVPCKCSSLKKKGSSIVTVTLLTMLLFVMRPHLYPQVFLQNGQHLSMPCLTFPNI